MPRSTANTLVESLLLTAALVGAAGCHGNRSEEPPVHIIQNMDFQSR